MTQTEAAAPTSRVDPQRMAWGVLLLSFAVFCVVCVIIGLGVHYFLFQSVVPMVSELQVGRGSVGITYPSDPDEVLVPDARTLSGGNEATVRTDPQSQATISFYDPYESDRLVATVTLKNNTILTMRQASRPRFDWSTVRYDIVLDDFIGDLDVFVAQGLERDFVLSIQTPTQHLILLTDSGRYLAASSNSEVAVTNIDGHAILVPPDSSSGIPISSGNEGIGSTADALVVLSPTRYTNLLANTVFPEDSAINGSPDETAADLWVCTNGENDTPPGDFLAEMIDGRTALRLVRAGDITSHGETRCLKWFGQNRYSLDGYDYVALQTTFYINFHSLNACGERGSECPLMLQLDYIDAEDNARRWFYGFYSLDPRPGWPKRCDTVTCVQDHQQINEHSWYTFDSGNLFDLFQQNQLPLPKSIVSVHFYASGHQYDVYVADVALLVGQNTPGSNDEAAANAPGG